MRLAGRGTQCKLRCKSVQAVSGHHRSMPELRLANGLPDFNAAIRTFIDEIDFGHAPMRFDLAHIHGLHSDAAGTNDRSHLDVTIVNVGWHVRSPHAKAIGPRPCQAYRWYGSGRSSTL